MKTATGLYIGPHLTPDSLNRAVLERQFLTAFLNEIGAALMSSFHDFPEPVEIWKGARSRMNVKI